MNCDNCGKLILDEDEILCRGCKPSLQIKADIKKALADIDPRFAGMIEFFKEVLDEYRNHKICSWNKIYSNGQNQTDLHGCGYTDNLFFDWRNRQNQIRCSA
jgi:hypothetical protein